MKTHESSPSIKPESIDYQSKREDPRPVSYGLKCLRCDGEMVRGFIADRGDGNVRQQSMWMEGAPEHGVLGGLKIRPGKSLPVETFRCPTCGYLESYAGFLSPLKSS